MTGEKLRGEIDNISDIMDLVEEFMRQHDLLTNEVSRKIQYIRELSEDLFYAVPIGE